MKRILVAFVFLCAALSLLIGTPALSGRVSGLTAALKQLPPEDLQQVLASLGVSPVPAPVPKTGQTTSFALGDDGALQKGVPLSGPRFTDNLDGTVTDNLTGLVWTQNASMFELPWVAACAACNGLEDDGVDLTDGSVAGAWRLPNVRELQSLVDYGRHDDAFPLDHPFDGVNWPYWSSTSFADSPSTRAWAVSFYDGVALYMLPIGDFDKNDSFKVWCVRDGR